MYRQKLLHEQSVRIKDNKDRGLQDLEASKLSVQKIYCPH